MLCEQCHKKEANVHLTQVIDGVVKKLHLCEECAAQAGFDLEQSLSISDLLAGMNPELEDRIQHRRTAHLAPDFFVTAGRTQDQLRFGSNAHLQGQIRGRIAGVQRNHHVECLGRVTVEIALQKMQPV